MTEELEQVVLPQNTGFMRGLGNLINSVVDEAVVLLFGIAYSIMTYQAMMNGLSVPNEYTGAVLVLVVDYVKKKWDNEA